MAGLQLLSIYYSTILSELYLTSRFQTICLDSLAGKFNTNLSTNSNPATGKKLIDIIP